MYEHNRRPSCTVSDLVMGNEYSFRVFSENICGLSEEAGVSKNTAVIGKTGEGIPPRRKLPAGRPLNWSRSYKCHDGSEAKPRNTCAISGRL